MGQAPMSNPVTYHNIWKKNWRIAAKPIRQKQLSVPIAFQSKSFYVYV